MAHTVSHGQKTMPTYLLDPELEEAASENMALSNHVSSASEVLHLSLLDSLRSELSLLPPTAMTPPILVRDEIRMSVRKLVRNEFPRLTVLGYSDLPPTFNVQPLARIKFLSNMR